MKQFPETPSRDPRDGCYSWFKTDDGLDVRTIPTRSALLESSHRRFHRQQNSGQLFAAQSKTDAITAPQLREGSHPSFSMFQRASMPLSTLCSYRASAGSRSLVRRTEGKPNLLRCVLEAACHPIRCGSQEAAHTYGKQELKRSIRLHASAPRQKNRPPLPPSSMPCHRCTASCGSTL